MKETLPWVAVIALAASIPLIGLIVLIILLQRDPAPASQPGGNAVRIGVSKTETNASITASVGAADASAKKSTAP